MHRLEPVQYPLIRSLFHSPHAAFMLEAMIAGNAPAEIYVDDAAQPHGALLWDKTHGVYLAGDPENIDFLNNLIEFCRADWLPRAREYRILKIETVEQHWTDIVKTLLPDFTVEQYPRVFFAGDDHYTTEGWRDRIPAGFTLHRIDQAFLTNTHLAGMNETLEEIASCWTSMAQFYTDGFGYCLVTDTGEIASRCTAEYVSEGNCGIGIETAEAYQRRGFATLTASAFVAECQTRHLIPHWDSWLNNTPSVAVAEKIGLHKIQDYAVQLARIEDV